MGLGTAILQFLIMSCGCGFPLYLVFSCFAWTMWKPENPSVPQLSAADRFGWTVFVLGLCLMGNMFLYLMVAIDRIDYRDLESTPHYQELFLGTAVIAVSGHLFVYIYEKIRAIRSVKSRGPDEL